MNLNQIIAFCTVVKAGSISKAAKHLHLTQPALSVQIQELENYFQAKLLERTNRGVKTTPAGDLAYSYGERIMSLSEGLLQEINSIKELGSEEMMVGASSTIGGYALPCSIYAFKEKYPHSIIKLTISNARDIIEKTEDGMLDIGLVEGPFYQNSLKKEKLVAKNICEDELVLIADSKNQKNNGSIDLEELKKLPIILSEKGSGTRETIEKALQDNNIELNDLNLTMELNTIEAIKSSVEAGKGVSIISRLAVRKELRHKTLKALKVEGISFAHNFTVIYSSVKPKTSLQKTFLDFINCPRSRSFC